MTSEHLTRPGDATIAKQAQTPPAADRYMAVDSLSGSLTRIELSLMRFYGAFSSWAVELQKCVAGQQMSFQEVALLHCVRLRGGTTTLAEMMIFLHRHDIAAINYSLRKLEQYGLIKRLKTAYRREIAYSITESGRNITTEYARVRQETLVKLCREVLGLDAATHEACGAVERLTGIYDQATQSIFNLTFVTPLPVDPAVAAVEQAADGRPVKRASKVPVPRR